jgi:hypothetical protein
MKQDSKKPLTAFYWKSIQIADTEMQYCKGGTALSSSNPDPEKDKICCKGTPAESGYSGTPSGSMSCQDGQY